MMADPGWPGGVPYTAGELPAGEYAGGGPYTEGIEPGVVAAEYAGGEADSDEAELCVLGLGYTVGVYADSTGAEYVVEP